MKLAAKLRAAGLAIILSWGWKRAAIAIAAGALSALAMAPFNAWPVLFLTFPVVVWLIDGAAAGRRRGVPAAAMAGWWFGIGYFVPGLYSVCRPIWRCSPRSASRWRACCGPGMLRG